MKPLLRWTVGSVSQIGLFCLSISVRQAKKLFGDSFDYAICYNNLSEEEIKKLPVVDIYVNCHDYVGIYSIPPPVKGPVWKLYPARLRLDSHEICMDNDVILYGIPKELEFFLKDDLPLITEAFKRSYGGVLEPLVPNGINYNCGFVCLPPHYDFQLEISKLIDRYHLQWNNYFADQTIIAYLFSRMRHGVVGLDEINVCAEEAKMGTCGVHLVGINTNKTVCGLDIVKQLILG